MRARGVIVLEGCDGTGKTTLARKLVAEHDGVYIHNRYHKDVWPFFMATLRWAQRASHDRLVVVDRHWVSECVYARAYRGGSALPWDVRALARVWARLGALNVLCLPPLELVIQNHDKLKNERVEMYDKVNKVALLYQQLWDGHAVAWRLPSEPPVYIEQDYVEQLADQGVSRRHDWARYDFTAGTSEVGFRAARWTLLERLQGVREMTWARGMDTFPGELSGNPKVADVLLVGDRSNADRPNWPFCHNAGSSSFLNKTLHTLRADESFLAYANLHDCTRTAAGAVRLLEACELAGSVVALGGRASTALGIMKVKHLNVRHPQHARRFTHHGERYLDELGSALKAAGFAAHL